MSGGHTPRAKSGRYRQRCGGRRAVGDDSTGQMKLQKGRSTGLDPIDARELLRLTGVLALRNSYVLIGLARRQKMLSSRQKGGLGSLTSSTLRKLKL